MFNDTHLDYFLNFSNKLYAFIVENSADSPPKHHMLKHFIWDILNFPIEVY